VGSFIAGFCDYCSGKILWPGGTAVPYDPKVTHFGSLRLLLCETCIPRYKRAIGLPPDAKLPQIVFTLPDYIETRADIRTKLLSMTPGSRDSFKAKSSTAHIAAKQLGMKIMTCRTEGFRETRLVNVRRVA